MQVANLYDNGPISPIAQILEHLAIWSEQRWMPFRIEDIEPLPRSSPFIIDLITISGGVPLVPTAAIAGQLVGVLQVNANELVHFRWFAIDDIEGQLWELSRMARFSSRGAQAGVNLFTPVYDPWLTTTTFWVLGGPGDKDARVGCTNIGGAILPQARLGFFGYKYILKSEATIHQNARYLPAQGR